MQISNITLFLSCSVFPRTPVTITNPDLRPARQGNRPDDLRIFPNTVVKPIPALLWPHQPGGEEVVNFKTLKDISTEPLEHEKVTAPLPLGHSIQTLGHNFTC